MKEKFTGTFFEVEKKLADWKAANPTLKIIHEGSPLAMGEKASLLDEPVWVLTIEHEDAPSN